MTREGEKEKPVLWGKDRNKKPGMQQTEEKTQDWKDVSVAGGEGERLERRGLRPREDPLGEAQQGGRKRKYLRKVSCVLTALPTRDPILPFQRLEQRSQPVPPRMTPRLRPVTPSGPRAERAAWGEDTASRRPEPPGGRGCGSGHRAAAGTGSGVPAVSDEDRKSLSQTSRGNVWVPRTFH